MNTKPTEPLSRFVETRMDLDRSSVGCFFITQWAVLVAISIPVFTSQLEKAREATDLSNIRAAYAEVVTAILTGDVSSAKVGNNLGITGAVNENADFVLSVASFPIQQKQNNWQTADPQIASVKINDSTFTVADTTTLYLQFTHASDGDILLKAWSVGTAIGG